MISFFLSCLLKEPVEKREMKTSSLLVLLLFVAKGAYDDVKYISKRNSGRIKQMFCLCRPTFYFYLFQINIFQTLKILYPLFWICFHHSYTFLCNCLYWGETPSVFFFSALSVVVMVRSLALLFKKNLLNLWFIKFFSLVNFLCSCFLMLWDLLTECNGLYCFFALTSSVFSATTAPLLSANAPHLLWLPSCVMWGFLTFSLIDWYGKCSKVKQMELQRVIRSAQNMTKSIVTSLEDIYTGRCRTRAKNMMMNPGHELLKK